MAIPMYNYGLIGNCQISALISHSASMDWLCLPRPDSPPVFGKLLDTDGGSFEILLNEPTTETKQRYVTNTNILETIITLADGSQLKITDFAPRFEQYGRMYRPCSIFRKIEPLAGMPNILIKISPVDGWSKNKISPIRGNSHLKFMTSIGELRVTTNMPLTHLVDEVSIQVQNPIYFAMTWGEQIEDQLEKTAENFLLQTHQYWRKWVQHCNVPSLYQKETIRSALALKLHCYEDTGAILAALTTSLPEEVGRERNWDYRYCWLRDAHFVLSAFRNIGHFEEMEGFLKYLLALTQQKIQRNLPLSPVYDLTGQLPIPEETLLHWSGYKNSKPVRVFNQAAEHVQNDIYGELILTFFPIYLDERFIHLRTKQLEELMVYLLENCANKLSEPDAGLWEIRENWKVHHFSTLLCWAGLNRGAYLEKQGFLPKLKFNLREKELKSLEYLKSKNINQIIYSTSDTLTLDASLSLLSVLNFPSKEMNETTLMEIIKHLECKSNPYQIPTFFYRYKNSDDFGTPQSAFIICSFWIAQALFQLGKTTEAKLTFENTLNSLNSLGLMAEHFEPNTGTQLGNFPQAYSHVGLINTAFCISPRWEDINFSHEKTTLS